jgi:diguanylate cyclase (GGDEF)-like protein/PAS domain S-box-containing protein
MVHTLNEAGFTWLFNAAPDAMLVADGSGVIVAANPRAEALFGWPKEEFLGMKVESLMPERFRQGHVEKRRRYLSAPRHLEMGAGPEVRACRRDGTEFRAEISLSPLQQERPNLVLVAIRDISERLLAEQRFLQERERALVTLTSIADAVITTDPTGVIDYLNPAAERLTGWAVATAAGQPLDRVLPLVSDLSGLQVESPARLCLREGSVTPEEHVSLRRIDGSLLPVAYNVAPILDPGGNTTGVVVVFRDVLEQRRVTRRLSHEATHDSLTALVNRAEFERRVDRALAHASAGSPATLCYMDLDHFKRVNDRWGHMAGDEVLRQAATVMNGMVRQRDTVARLGGDEFAALLENCTVDEGVRIGRKIQLGVVNHRFSWRDQSFHLGISVGVVALDPEVDADSLLLAADGACYVSKAGGGVTVEVARLGGPFARQP